MMLSSQRVRAKDRYLDHGECTLLVRIQLPIGEPDLSEFPHLPQSRKTRSPRLVLIFHSVARDFQSLTLLR